MSLCTMTWTTTTGTVTAETDGPTMTEAKAKARSLLGARTAATPATGRQLELLTDEPQEEHHK